jgi:glutamyl/glutaminyl-tRNA synthetase
MQVGRFAPSTTGPAHPGTLLAGMLCWLDARVKGGRVVLRLEDLDPQRCRPEHLEAMQSDLAWLGLEWDEVVVQSTRSAAHAAALDELAAAGLLYPCCCSRAEVRAAGTRAPDGSWCYPGTCRERPLPGTSAGGWRECSEAIRVRLPAGRIELVDESGLDLSQDPAGEYGDPVVRRRDGAIAYHLASVVDDRHSAVTRVVRGRDLAASTAVQIALQRLLGFSTPRYRHHLLLLESHGGKLAKFHGAVAASELRRHYDASELCGLLAHAAGLIPDAVRITPPELVERFSWRSVREDDRVLSWQGGALSILPDPA